MVLVAVEFLPQPTRCCKHDLARPNRRFKKTPRTPSSHYGQNVEAHGMNIQPLTTPNERLKFFQTFSSNRRSGFGKKSSLTTNTLPVGPHEVPVGAHDGVVMLDASLSFGSVTAADLL